MFITRELSVASSELRVRRPVLPCFQLATRNWQLATSSTSRPRTLLNHRDGRLPDDLQVQPPRGVFDVLQVVLDPFLEIGPRTAGAADLPEAGDAGAYAQPRLAPRRAELIFVVRAGTRADDRHVPEQHVEELRQLVEVVLAQVLTNLGQPRIVLDEELRAVRLVEFLQVGLDPLGVLPHRAELDARELASAHRLALVREEERPA